METLVASRHLLRLRDSGLLVARGQSRATYYVPSEALVTSLSNNYEPLSSKLEPLSSNLPTLSSKLPELPQDILDAIEHLGRRASPSEVRAILLRVCSVRPMQAREIAELLRRQRVYIQNEYLRPLVEAGKLALGYPDQPNHPLQTYRTVRPGGTD